MRFSPTKAAVAATLLALSPVAASATTVTDGTTTTTVETETEERQGNDFPWGLLGLLGLAGLLGRGKKDDVHVHRTTTTVDPRTDGNPRT